MRPRWWRFTPARVAIAAGLIFVAATSLVVQRDVEGNLEGMLQDIEAPVASGAVPSVVMNDSPQAAVAAPAVATAVADPVVPQPAVRPRAAVGAAAGKAAATPAAAQAEVSARKVATVDTVTIPQFRIDTVRHVRTDTLRILGLGAGRGAAGGMAAAPPTVESRAANRLRQEAAADASPPYIEPFVGCYVFRDQPLPPVLGAPPRSFELARDSVSAGAFGVREVLPSGAIRLLPTGSWRLTSPTQAEVRFGDPLRYPAPLVLERDAEGRFQAMLPNGERVPVSRC